MMLFHSPFTNHQLLQLFFDQSGNLAHIGAALDFGFQYSHDLAHIPNGGCAGFLDRFLDQLPDLLITQWRGQIRQHYGKFPVFLVCEIITPGIFKLRY